MIIVTHREPRKEKGKEILNVVAGEQMPGNIS
jgi:hypothetical protein